MKKEFLIPEKTGSEKCLESLKETLFDREPSQKYEELARKARLIRMMTAYSESLVGQLITEKGLRELGKFLVEKAEGGVVVDLGCGHSYHISSFFRHHCKTYVGIDLNPHTSIPVVSTSVVRLKKRTSPDDLPFEVPDYLRKAANEESKLSKEPLSEEEEVSFSLGPNYHLVSGDDFSSSLEIQDDMLRAISRFKSESVSIVIIGGIEDAEVSAAAKEATTIYLRALEKEVKRVLKPGGVAVIYASDLNPQGLLSVDIKNALGIKVRQKVAT